MNKIISCFLILFYSLGIFTGLFPKNETPYTPLSGREYTDGEIEPEDTVGRFVSVDAVEEGTDVFIPTEEKGGYRYGPTVFSNADGSIDAFFASTGGFGRWDVITYRHSPDGGKNWTDEKIVLEPTAGSDDALSCCDPGVIKIGDYWYIGYTSTLDTRGLFNHVFVARSRNIDGPYEKWNGSGWGGDPEPIVVFDGGEDYWGAGEPSFVLRDDRLYIYYSWNTSVNETRLCIADANNENWPASMEYMGTAAAYEQNGGDSADIKYIDDYGKFIAFRTGERFSGNSYIDVYISDDGLKFTRSCIIRENIAAGCHNCGVSSRTNGHVRLSDKKYLGYAYGLDWGDWATRIAPITMKLCDEPDFSDESVRSKEVSVNHAPLSYVKAFSGIICESGTYDCSVGRLKTVKTFCFSAGVNYHQRVRLGITYSGYDKNTVRIVGGIIIPLSEGETPVTVEWNGFRTNIKVRVTK